MFLWYYDNFIWYCDNFGGYDLKKLFLFKIDLVFIYILLKLWFKLRFNKKII
jgi:hypothetical protein